MNKATYLRQCAHNRSERLNVVSLMSEKCSRTRHRYLKNQLTHLLRERDFFLSIKHEFNIGKRDCWIL